MKVNVHEAKSQLSRLAELAWQGEEVVICKAGTSPGCTWCRIGKGWKSASRPAWKGRLQLICGLEKSGGGGQVIGTGCRPRHLRKRATMKSMTTAESATAAPPPRQHPLASLLCDLLPSQGHWSDDACLWLTDHTSCGPHRIR